MKYSFDNILCINRNKILKNIFCELKNIELFEIETTKLFLNFDKLFMGAKSFNSKNDQAYITKDCVLQ